MAIEVIDEWQRSGIGRALLDALSRHAQTAGVERFTAFVSMENIPMQRILMQAGAAVEKVDGELEYTVDVVAMTAQAARKGPQARRHHARVVRAARPAAAAGGLLT